MKTTTHIRVNVNLNVNVVAAILAIIFLVNAISASGTRPPAESDHLRMVPEGETPPGFGKVKCWRRTRTAENFIVVEITDDDHASDPRWSIDFYLVPISPAEAMRICEHYAL
jgi:hypothetical protein